MVLRGAPRPELTQTFQYALRRYCGTGWAFNRSPRRSHYKKGGGFSLRLVRFKLQLRRNDRLDQEVDEHHRAEHDPVPAKRLEVVLFDKVHQEFDREQGDNKRRDHPDQQDCEFAACEQRQAGLILVDPVGADLQDADADHRRDRQEERELRGDCAGAPDDHRAQNRRAGAGRAGDDGEHLEQADQKRRLVGEIVERVDLRGARPALDHQEEHTVDNQHQRHNDVVHQVFVHDVVEQQTDHCGRDARYDHLEPHLPRIAALLLRLGLECKRVELLEEHHHHGDDRAQLDHIQEHIHERLADVELDKLIHQNHVARAADGQPLRDPLDDPEEDRL